MPSSPRCRSTSGFAESPSSISHAESSPPATIDSGYFSMGNNDRGHWMDIEYHPDSTFALVDCIAGPLDLGCRTEFNTSDFWQFSGE